VPLAQGEREINFSLKNSNQPHSRKKKVMESLFFDEFEDRVSETGQNQGLVFNSRLGCVHAMQLHCYETKQPNLKLKTRPKQLLDPLP
jgi:hypothetical protein